VTRDEAIGDGDVASLAWNTSSTCRASAAVDEAALVRLWREKRVCLSPPALVEPTFKAAPLSGLLSTSQITFALSCSISSISGSHDTFVRTNKKLVRSGFLTAEPFMLAFDLRISGLA
jgi:hypothetical protein